MFNKKIQVVHNVQSKKPWMVLKVLQILLVIDQPGYYQHGGRREIGENETNYY